MSTHVYEPKPDRPPRVEDPDNPRTLFEAKERIGVLSAELARLKGSTSTLPIGNKQPALTTSKPTAPTTGPTATQTAWERECARASAARLEGLSTKPFQEQTADELRIALNNETDSSKRTQIFKLIKLREEENSLSGPRVRLHGS